MELVVDLARDLTPPAGVLWAITIGCVLAADAILVHQHRETMSEWYGRHALLLAVVTIYLLLHLHGRPKRLSRYDPLHRIANRLR